MGDSLSRDSGGTLGLRPFGICLNIRVFLLLCLGDSLSRDSGGTSTFIVESTFIDGSSVRSTVLCDVGTLDEKLAVWEAQLAVGSLATMVLVA